MKAMKTSHPVRGLTLRAVAASLLGMLLAGIYTQVSAVLLAESYLIAEAALPVPAMIVLVFLGTLYQHDYGLYLSQEKFVYSWIVWFDIGGEARRVPERIGTQHGAFRCGGVFRRGDEHRHQIHRITIRDGAKRLRCDVAVGIVRLMKIENRGPRPLQPTASRMHGAARIAQGAAGEEGTSGAA